MTATGYLHAPGFEELEAADLAVVVEVHRAECPLCDWRSDEFDDLAWKDAEEAAVEHYEEEHAHEDDDDDELDEDEL